MAGENSQTLEQQLERKLHDARRIGGAHYAKPGELSTRLNGQRISHSPVRLAKLSVIESIEQFHAEFGVHALGYRRIFQKRDIPVVEARPGEETPPGRS